MNRHIAAAVLCCILLVAGCADSRPQSDHRASNLERSQGQSGERPANAAKPQSKLDDEFAIACWESRFGDAEKLLDQGANPDSLVPGEHRGFVALTPCLKDPGFVDLMIEKGADVNKVDANGLVPVEFAASEATIEVVKKLEAAGVDLTKPFPDGRTFLHAAMTNPRAEVIDYALSKGIDINAKDSLGFTALHCAVVAPLVDATQRIATIKKLLAKGADRNAKDNQGRKPHDLLSRSSLAQSKDRQAISALLEPPK